VKRGDVVKSQALILVEDMDWRWIKHSTKQGGVEVDRKNLRTEEIHCKNETT